MSYYLVTYDGGTEKNLECRVYGLKEGEHYPVVRPETFSRESEKGDVYDSLERCYMVEFSKDDERKEYYFTMAPETDMAAYRNIHLGKWEKDVKGWRYQYQGEYLTSWAKINDKWYHFDGNGRMETGWILDDMYYTGDDGVMRTGWQKLYPPDNYEEDSNKVIPGAEGGTLDYGEDGQYWYYFGTNGKKYVPSDGNDNGDYGTRKIDGIYYCFDDDGILQMGWKNVRGSSDSIKDYMYFGSDGKAKIGWYSIEPPEDLEGYDGDVEWFYFANNGKPKAADSDHLTTQDLTKISGKTYLFNKRGNPVYGLKKVYIGSGDSNWTAFYFGTKTQSCVQRGKMKVEEDDGNKTDFYFSENGRGYTGVKDNYLYYKGKLQKATDGQKYVCYKIDSSNYVVNSSGKVMKNSTVKTSDGVKFKTSSSGSLSTADDDNDVSSYFTEPEEPNCTED